MQTDTTYNGWTNYATWRVNLEVFDGMDIRDDFDGNIPDLYELSQWAKEYADEVVSDFGESNGLAVDFARAFLSDVDWSSIARHLIENASEAA